MYVATKSDDKYISVDANKPVNATKKVIEKKLSLIFPLSFSDDKNLTTVVDKLISAREEISEIVIEICDQMP